MKKKPTPPPSRSKLSVLRQLCNLIPPRLTAQLARQTGVHKRARTFSPWSHVVSLLYAQAAHSLSLNDVCDTLQLHLGPLSALRGATPPARNTLSHANRVRDARLAESLFWRTLVHLQSWNPGFARGPKFRLARRFRRTLHAVDSTNLELVAHCLPWAHYQHRKAAAKCHVRLHLQRFLPQFVCVDPARFNDKRHARAACADVRSGEIVVFDKAYIDFGHLHELHLRGVVWVSRARADLACRVIRPLARRLRRDPRVQRDELIELTSPPAHRKHPTRLRRVVARVTIQGREQESVFLTNQLNWTAGSVAELYRCRWQIEVFFKQIKQTLQLADFLGQSANAVRWQVWTALLVYVLLRFWAWTARWAHSFARLFTVVRGVLWERLEVGGLLRRYGTARVRLRCVAQADQAYFAFAR